MNCLASTKQSVHFYPATYVLSLCLLNSFNVAFIIHSKTSCDQTDSYRPTSRSNAKRRRIKFNPQIAATSI